MFGAERRQLILDLVRAQGAVSIRELAAAVNASEVTVRRDVSTLEGRGLLDHSHGGVMVPGEDYSESHFVAAAAVSPRTPMFGAERRQLIRDLVRANKVVSLHDLALATGATEVTVRRDLIALERRGLVQRAHGGAFLPDALIFEPWPIEERVASTEAKAAIAALAATLVGGGDAIMLGAGTTVHELARRLAPRSPLTVLTNSMLVARALARTAHVELVLTRGSLDSRSQALVGSDAERWMSNHRVSRAFISGAGLTTDNGLSNTHLGLSSVDRAIVASAQDVVVLADHSKLGVECTYRVAPISRIDHLVTNEAPDTSLIDTLSARGVTVHVAPRVTVGALSTGA